MPFIFDFNSSVDEMKTVEVHPKGWVSPLYVEYIVAQAHKYDTTMSVVWRVKGTTHSFTMSEQKLNRISQGNYEKHFTETLEGFRKDYLLWFKDDMYKDVTWKYEYQGQFGKYILEQEPDNTSENQQDKP